MPQNKRIIRNKRKSVIKQKKVVKQKRNSYSIEQKEVVVAYAKQHGRNKAANHFNINGSMVGRWVKASKGWTDETDKKSKRIGSGRKPFYPEAEEKLCNWLIG